MPINPRLRQIRQSLDLLNHTVDGETDKLLNHIERENARIAPAFTQARDKVSKHVDEVQKEVEGVGVFLDELNNDNDAPLSEKSKNEF